MGCRARGLTVLPGVGAADGGQGAAAARHVQLVRHAGVVRGLRPGHDEVGQVKSGGLRWGAWGPAAAGMRGVQEGGGGALHRQAEDADYHKSLVSSLPRAHLLWVPVLVPHMAGSGEPPVTMNWSKSHLVAGGGGGGRWWKVANSEVVVGGSTRWWWEAEVDGDGQWWWDSEVDLLVVGGLGLGQHHVIYV